MQNAPGPLADSSQGTWTFARPRTRIRTWTFVRPRTKKPAPLHDLTQRRLNLRAAAYKGTWTFARARAKIPGPLCDVIQRCQDL
eukprot:3448916-Alexandrium_andersonii.AAC.1